VPPTYDGTTPMPVVLGLHGWSEPAVVFGIRSDLPAAADEGGFVAVLPDITRPTPLWDTALDGADVQWVGALLDTLEETLCVDTNRVFVTGMSNGAMMTSTLACTMADRFAAVAPVAGVRLPDDCRPARPVPMIAFHGTDDQYLAFDGGYGDKVAGLASPDGSGTLGSFEATGPDAVPVPDRVAAWAALDGCDGDLTTEPVADDVTLSSPTDCGVPVQLYVVDGGGHSWPGSDFDAGIGDYVGPVTESIDATALILDFFSDHPLG
jgi:polyhydroxybutyrate depolymerase